MHAPTNLALCLCAQFCFVYRSVIKFGGARVFVFPCRMPPPRGLPCGCVRLSIFLYGNVVKFGGARVLLFDCSVTNARTTQLTLWLCAYFVLFLYRSAIQFGLALVVLFLLFDYQCPHCAINAVVVCVHVNYCTLARSSSSALSFFFTVGHQVWGRWPLFVLFCCTVTNALTLAAPAVILFGVFVPWRDQVWNCSRVLFLCCRVTNARTAQVALWLCASFVFFCTVARSSLGVLAFFCLL